MIHVEDDFRVSHDLLSEYFRALVNRFFKILPIRESEDKSLTTYIRSLQIELTGCGAFIERLDRDPQYLSLLSVLQYLQDNPDCSVKEVRREVFNAISICNKLRDKYSEGGDTE